MATAAAIETPKRKKEKSSKSEKKRAREEDATVPDTERKHKKSKSVSFKLAAAAENGQLETELEAGCATPVKEKQKKEKKEKKSKQRNGVEAIETTEAEAPASEKKKHKKKKPKDTDGEATSTDGVEATNGATDDNTTEKSKKKKSKSKHSEEEVPVQPEEQPEESAEADSDAMDIDQPSKPSSSHIYQPPDIPANPQFPFYSQTVSLYEPIYPNGWAQPVTNCDYQYLRHLQNRYVPSLRGVLLDYRNVALGENPGREGAATEDDAPAMLKSQNEYAVGFGWITADVDLFVPTRGSWMEGSVNLQTEGHIGVVCFGKFNASIEARRLPSSWKWVSNEDPDARGMEETASVITADDHGVVRQIHSTGFWADGEGEKVKGKIRFRIRNFDVGFSGETSYLSLEGTMLGKQAEKKLVKDEAKMVEMRRGQKGGRGAERRRAPDFSMTRFTDDAEQQAAAALVDASEVGVPLPGNLEIAV